MMELIKRIERIAAPNPAFPQKGKEKENENL
jgi:hypothetical protein